VLQNGRTGIIIHYLDIGVVGAFAEESEKIAEIRQGRQLDLLSALPNTYGP